MTTTDTALPDAGARLDERAPADATVSMLLAACDEELAFARRLLSSSMTHHDRDGRRDTQLDSVYSRAGFASGGRATLATIVGDGVHSPRASTEVQRRYDGWATIAERAGQSRLAGELRRYVVRHGGADSVLVPEAVEYLEGARRIIAAT